MNETKKRKSQNPLLQSEFYEKTHSRTDNGLSPSGNLVPTFNFSRELVTKIGIFPTPGSNKDFSLCYGWLLRYLGRLKRDPCDAERFAG